MVDVFTMILKYTAIVGGVGILAMGAFAFVMMMLSPVFILAEWLEMKKKKK
jgi:hypothetical protein